MKRLAQLAGGSHKTVHDRIKLAQRFCERLVLAQNVQIRRVEQLKARHIEGYVRERLAQGITKRSLQNEMAAVRCILKQAGRDRLAQSERLNNLSLGLSGASRNGTRRAITPERYCHVLETARAKNPGIAAALELSRLLGLRSQEAVQSAQSLRTWRQALERGDTRLTVVFLMDHLPLYRIPRPEFRFHQCAIGHCPEAMPANVSFSIVTHQTQRPVDCVFTHWLIRVMVAGEHQFQMAGDFIYLLQNSDSLTRKRHYMWSTHFCATTRETDFLNRFPCGGDGPDFVSEINLAPAAGQDNDF